jgi:hypothetical protein
MTKRICDLCKKEETNGDTFRKLAIVAFVGYNLPLDLMTDKDLCNQCFDKILNTLGTVLNYLGVLNKEGLKSGSAIFSKFSRAMENKVWMPEDK